MKLKRIKQLKLPSFTFNVTWDKSHAGGSFDYDAKELIIGTRWDEDHMFNTICHELWEIVSIEHGVRLSRPDVEDDYIWVYDHRQHMSMCSMFSGLVREFIV